MKKKALGINDIARELHISITTVSFILNGKAKEKRISDSLSKKVLDYVKKVNYSPNHLAQSLRTGRTNLIGLIVEDISNPFFANVARLIEEKAYEKGFRIIYCSSENDTVKTRELIKVFHDRQVDAYIITPSSGSEPDIKSLLKEKLPVVLFDRYFPELISNYVVVDNSGSTYNAICHLVEQGYKNIAFVSLVSDQTQMNERLDGYNKAIDKYKLQSHIKRVLYHENRSRTVQEIASFLGEDDTIDAVFFATNYLAIDGLEAIKNLKKKIPADIGVVAFDDHDLFRLYSPSITAVSQPIEEMSDQLIHILLEGIKVGMKPTGGKKIMLQAPLIIRNSTAKRKK